MSKREPGVVVHTCNPALGMLMMQKHCEVRIGRTCLKKQKGREGKRERRRGEGEGKGKGGGGRGGEGRKGGKKKRRIGKGKKKRRENAFMIKSIHRK
jgi:hypothetical protein